jgi:class 3 adenylate cyclase
MAQYVRTLLHLRQQAPQLCRIKAVSSLRLALLSGISASKPDIRINRKLAAILAADVVGYSSLMGADEAGTLAALKRHRSGAVGETRADC